MVTNEEMNAHVQSIINDLRQMVADEKARADYWQKESERKQKRIESLILQKDDLREELRHYRPDEPDAFDIACERYHARKEDGL